jgi:hypothetical protein
MWSVSTLVLIQAAAILAMQRVSRLPVLANRIWPSFGLRVLKPWLVLHRDFIINPVLAHSGWWSHVKVGWLEVDSLFRFSDCSALSRSRLPTRLSYVLLVWSVVVESKTFTRIILMVLLIWEHFV